MDDVKYAQTWALDTGTDPLTKNEPKSFPGIAEMLSAGGWMGRVFPPSECFLGDLVSSKSRIFLAGYTGLGKTMLGMAMAVGMATGKGFLNWRSSRPARVLYLDGEMPGNLLQERISDAVRRSHCNGPPTNLFAYSADFAETVAKVYPGLGVIAPLNTEEGQTFLYTLIGSLGGVDVIIFDNVMSLVVGDQKDEVPWSETLPLVQQLTMQNIAQVWLDHTGHNATQQYGSSTKAWRMDALGIMTRLSDPQPSDEMAFKLSFEHPGKARRRTSKNWEQFAPQVIRLRNDIWTTDAAGAIRQETKVPPSRAVFYDALVAALATSTTMGETTLGAWEISCIRRGLIDSPSEGGPARVRRLPLRRAQSALIAARWIAVEGERVMDLKHRF